MSAADSLPRVLAIHAHPDDIEILCAGTLLRLAARGCEVIVATMTPGDAGSAEHSAEEISSIRRAEARQAADMLGAEYHCLEFNDLQIVHDNDSRRRVSEFFRRVRPDVVFTAPPVDYMSDHEITSLLVRDACFSASVPNYRTRQWEPAAPTDQIPHLYYCDPIGGVDWFGQPIPPGFIVDISAEIETKLEMLACHESQRNWLRKQHGMDEYLDNARAWSQARGAEIGVDYAEGFRQHTGHPFPHDNIVQRLLDSAGGGV